MNHSSTRSDQHRRRVLLLGQDLEPWGAQRQLVELAKGLDPSCYDVRVATIESGGALTAELAAAGIPVVAFPRGWRWDLSPITRLATYLREQQIDIVHSFLFLPNFYARLAGRHAQTPAVVSSLRSTGIEGWPRYALDIATCFLCDAMIANSAAGGDHYVRRGGLRSRVTVVRNGLQPPVNRNGSSPVPPRAAALDRFAALVGMIGAFEPRKNQDMLIRAMVDVARQHPGTGLVLGGDGSRRGDLEALVDQLGARDTVVLCGQVPNPHALYPRLAVYVQASRQGEGISNSLLEAMSHGIPVVATDVGGNREVIEDQRSGYIVPADDAAALAACVARLIGDAALRERMGAAARARFQSAFSIEQMVNATCAVYDRVLQPAVARPPTSTPQPFVSPHTARPTTPE